MKKKVIVILLAVVLLLGIVAVWNFHTQEFPQLNWIKKGAIEDAWLAEYGISLEWYSTAEPLSFHSGMRYYGSDNGYDILFYPGSADIEEYKLVAGEIFSFSKAFTLLVYKDGEFLDLRETYNNGLLSKEAIVKAKEIHDAYQDALTASRNTGT